MAIFLVISLIYWFSLFFIAGSEKSIRGKLIDESRGPYQYPLPHEDNQFQFSLNLARIVYARLSQKLPIFLSFIPFTVTLMFIMSKLNKDLVTTVKDYATVPLMLFLIFSIIGILPYIAITTGAAQRASLIKLSVSRGELRYFYIGRRERQSNNPTYWFYQDTIKRIYKITEYEHMLMILCDVERETFKHQDTHLSEESIRPTGIISTESYQMLAIPKVFLDMPALVSSITLKA